MEEKIIEIKNKIKNVLKEKNMNIYQLSLKSEVTEACIRNWYSKRNYAPSIESLYKIAKALDLSLSQIFLDNDATLYPVDSETKELIDNFILLDPDKKQLIIQLAKSYNKIKYE